MENRADKAAQLFLQGYNCAQAVAVAFCDLTGQTPEEAAKMASCFGGGMGRMREVCGAVSGMFLVLGQLKGYSDPAADAEKAALYAKVQELAEKFREQWATILCRDLLDDPPCDPHPSPRTSQYYQERPCAAFVYTAAQILAEELKQS